MKSILFIFISTSFFLNAQNAEEYYTFEIDNFVKIADYYYINEILVIDFYTLRYGTKIEKSSIKRTYVLPQNQYNIKLPSKTRLFLDKIFNFGKIYKIKIECRQNKEYVNIMTHTVYLPEYDALIQNELTMYWHVCELLQIEKWKKKDLPKRKK